MRELVGLPKNADIVCPELNNLIVRNHKVLNYDGLMAWLMGILKYGYWEVVLPQMIQQGFHFEAVIEYCIGELRDPSKISMSFFVEFVANYVCERQMLAHNLTGKTIAGYAIGMIQNCKNWADFQKLMTRNGDFHKKMEDKVWSGIEQCIH